MSAYQLTVRQGPRIERDKRESLDEVLEAVEAYARTATRREAVDFVSRRYEPGDLVALRIEVKGGGVRAGLDVHGDGSAVAWKGRLSRTIIEPEPGESPLGALRRTLTA